MSLRVIAQEAYIKVEALEELLVSKGIIAAGEAKAYHDAIIKKRSEEFEASWRIFWDRILPGDKAEFCDSPAFDGTILEKSPKPREFLFVEVTRRYFLKWHKKHVHRVEAIGRLVIIHSDGIGEQSPSFGI